jgi:hypothetical protein
MDENLDALKHDADMKTYAEGEEPWRMQSAEIGLRIAFADNNQVVIIGSRESLTAERIVLALERLDPDIKMKYVEACKLLVEKERNELNEEIERLKKLNEQFRPEPIVIHNRLNIPEIKRIEITKPHNIKHHEFKRVKPTRRKR